MNDDYVDAGRLAFGHWVPHASDAVIGRGRKGLVWKNGDSHGEIA